MTKPFRVVAFDPGGTTGWAMYDENELGEYKFTCGQLSQQDHHLELYNFMTHLDGPNTIFVTESFEFRNKHRDNVVLISVAYIGVMDLYCQANRRPLIKQTAGMGKGFTTDATLKKLDLYSQNFRHAMDAYRHLLFYLINTMEVDCRLELLQKGWR